MKFLAIFLAGVVMYFLINHLSFSKDISYYYAYLDSREKATSNFVPNTKDLENFLDCGSSYECIRGFYEDLTKKHGVGEAFSFLNFINIKYKNYFYLCHQSAHGIGHGALQLNDLDLQKTFLAPFQAGITFDLINCGAGYFHGAVEEKTKGVNSVEDLVSLLQGVCENKKIVNNRVQSCLHGVGHAVFLQLEKDENLKERTQTSLSVCDKMSQNFSNLYNCYAGVFMQISFDFPAKELISKVGENYNFSFCNYFDDKFKYACIMELSPLLETFLQKEFQTPDQKYAQLIKECQSIVDNLGKIACIKKIAEDAVLNWKITNVENMCIENTKTKAERVFCVSVFAGRIAKSLDVNLQSSVSKQSIKDICNTLSTNEASTCVSLVTKNFNQTYVVTSKDLQI